MKLNRSADVNLTKWARKFLKEESQSFDEHINCTDVVTIFNKLFLEDLCSTGANFARQRGSLQQFCPDTCGVCIGSESPSAREERLGWDNVQEKLQKRGLKFMTVNDALQFEDVGDMCNQVVKGSNIGNDGDLGQPSGDVLYQLEAKTAGTYTFYMADTMDGYLTIISGSTGQVLGESDMHCGSDHQQLVKVHNVKAGEKLIILAEGYGNNEGCFELQTVCPDSTDQFDFEKDIECNADFKGEDIECDWEAGDSSETDGGYSFIPSPPDGYGPDDSPSPSYYSGYYYDDSPSPSYYSSGSPSPSPSTSPSPF
jgi:hypothetical protein